MESKLQFYDPEDQELSIRGILFHVLYRWRSILVAALIFAVALGCYQYFSLKSVHDHGEKTKEEQEYEVELQTYWNNLEMAEKNIANYTQLIQQNQEYTANSMWLKLDPNDYWSGTRVYFVQVDQSVLDALPQGSQQDPADYVLNAYVSKLKTGLDLQALEALLGTSTRQYVNELISGWSDANANTLTLSANGGSEAEVLQRLDFLTQQMLEVCQPVAQEVAAHQLKAVSEDVYSSINTTLSNKQREQADNLTDYQKALQENQQSRISLLDDGEPVAPGDHIKKYAAIGFILGAVLLAGIYLVSYLMSGRLHQGEELTQLLGLPVFGEYPSAQARKRGPIDRWLARLENKHVITDEAVLRSGIAALLREQGSGQVVLTGSVPEEKLQALCQSLSEEVDSDIQLSFAPDVRTHHASIPAVKTADGVLLVEEKEVSRQADILREAEMLALAEAKVIGCIVL